jgi:hypothetical protein
MTVSWTGAAFARVLDCWRPIHGSYPGSCSPKISHCFPRYLGGSRKLLLALALCAPTPAEVFRPALVVTEQSRKILFGQTANTAR